MFDSNFDNTHAELQLLKLIRLIKNSLSTGTCCLQKGPTWSHHVSPDAPNLWTPQDAEPPVGRPECGRPAHRLVRQRPSACGQRAQRVQLREDAQGRQDVPSASQVGIPGPEWVGTPGRSTYLL